MANVKVTFLSTAAGSYGIAHKDDEKVVNENLAKDLEKAGLVKVGKSTTEDESVQVSGGVTFTDNTQKATGPAGETDPANPTGKDVPAAKSTPLRTAKSGTVKKAKK